ncbi:MCE family protein [Bailinhaonella thermotolerans]|uniref:MCE family protein n=1 Tax=Bailinhaonella thermotolerans TaxID=1070861 RepID=A0A3A4AVP7_9ACTN|nr:MCE family protein [Bailinhaonella thermotolerans]RJL34310.1 MCE family protein [Bailinhaonella thermotolerans]
MSGPPTARDRPAGARRPRIPRLIAAALAAALSAGACSIQTAGAPTGGPVLHGTFDDVQTLVAGHSVQVNDVIVGTVTDVRLEGYKAKVTMEIGEGRRIPAGTSAAIARTSLLGENYVKLILPPGKDLATGPFLASGARIENTSLQPDLELVTEKAAPVIDALGSQNIEAVADAVYTGFNGKGEQLHRLVERGKLVTDTYAAARHDLVRAVDDLARLGRALSKDREDLADVPESIARAGERLLSERKRLKKAVNELLKLARTANDTIYVRHAERLRTMLNRFDGITVAVYRGREDLKKTARDLLAFIKAPPIVHEGQAMFFAWIKGLLPPAGGREPGGKPKSPLDELGGKVLKEAPKKDFTMLLGPPR